MEIRVWGREKKWHLMFTKTAFVEWRRKMHSNGSTHVINGADWHAYSTQELKRVQMSTLVDCDTHVCRN